MINIKLDSLVQEFGVNGEVFFVRYDDDALNKFKGILPTVQAEYEKGMSEDREVEVSKIIINTVFGDNEYDRLYNACGRSSLNLGRVVESVTEWLATKQTEVTSKKKSHYVKKKDK